VVGTQSYRLSTADTHNVALQPIHGKIIQHYSQYSGAFCCVQKCELSYIYPEHNAKLHPHQVKLYRIGCVESGLVLVEGANVIISK